MTDFDQIDRAEVDATIHAVQAEIGTSFTWDYERSRPGLSRLYSKAKGSQWNATTDLDWSIDVDPERVSADLGGSSPVGRFGHLVDHPDSPVRSFGESEWTTVGVELQNSILSQFLHGEQGALLCTSRIVETVPWIDAKYYASTQVMDEARHVEVFARYLDEKLGRQYAINPNLKALLDDILTDSRWDVTYLGMQIMVEGLALAAFGFMRQATNEPLLQDLLRYVMSDEARHVAFGVLSLQEYYGDLTSDELRERQEFAFDAAVRLQKRFRNLEVWERMGVDGQAVSDFLDTHSYEQADVFQTMLFSKIVPNCKKLGLLDAADGWLRDRFTEIGVIQFEDWVDTAEEYEALDEVAADRAG
ncbi:MAG TPA: ferritin-like domain-containing protein [Microthrixaceae bacterium]|nr:ferritin-like domain-containing protein [Microthrixaceae bacterium]